MRVRGGIAGVGGIASAPTRTLMPMVALNLILTLFLTLSLSPNLPQTPALPLPLQLSLPLASRRTVPERAFREDARHACRCLWWRLVSGWPSSLKPQAPGLRCVGSASVCVICGPLPMGGRPTTIHVAASNPICSPGSSCHRRGSRSGCPWRTARCFATGRR
jgi:hypothetical protein